MKAVAVCPDGKDSVGHFKTFRSQCHADFPSGPVMPDGIHHKIAEQAFQEHAVGENSHAAMR